MGKKTKVEIMATTARWDSPYKLLETYPVLAERFNAKIGSMATMYQEEHSVVIVEIEGLAGLRDLTAAVGHDLIVNAPEAGSGVLLSVEIYDDYRE